MHIKYFSNLSHDTIYLSTKLNQSFRYKKVILHIGSFSKEVNVIEIEQDYIGLSDQLSDQFKIPEDLSYKIKCVNRHITIGPVICLMILSKYKFLTNEHAKNYLPYVSLYAQVNGLVFLASSKGLDIIHHIIKGYYYHPKDKSWIEGQFPYPDAMYRRVELTNSHYMDLMSQLGHRLFNSYFFNKWELWLALSPYKAIREHLPDTTKVTKNKDIEDMLTKYSSVYLKQIDGEKSKGIYKLNKTKNGYQFIDLGKREKVVNQLIEAEAILGAMKNQYIVQQAIKVKSFDNRHFDMRVVLQKDESKKWSVTSMIARFGGRDNVATNIWLDGYAMLGSEALRKVFDLNNEELFMKEQEIRQTCTIACDTLDQVIGNYGDVGIDLMIDETKKVWILEINKLYYQKYPIYALKNRQMYYDIAAKPLMYAYGLSGFCDNNLIE